MPTEISLSRKVGADLINVKTDLEPEAAVGLFADLVQLVATANEVGQLPNQAAPVAQPQVSVQQAAQNVTRQLGGQVVQPQHTDPRSPGYAQGPPPFDNGAPAKQCPHGVMARFDGVSQKNGRAYVRWDCPGGEKTCVKWNA
jgi:hypothetical protein